MSGHSKWANIKHRKGKADAARGAATTKISREITTAVRIGGADPTGNMRLKLALQNARENNIPKDNMEEFLTAIGRYKLDMLNDYNPVYDEDLSFCDKIMKDIVYQYVYDSDVYQRMMAGREVAQMQDAECEELKDIAEGQNCQIMQEL